MKPATCTRNLKNDTDGGLHQNLCLKFYKNIALLFNLKFCFTTVVKMEKPRKKLFFDELEVERNPLKLYIKSISNNSREQKGKEI